MKMLLKYMATATVCFAVQMPLLADTAQQAGEYRFKALKNCDVVFEQSMSDAQIDAYLDLQGQQVEMDQLQFSLEGVEGELSTLSEEVSRLTERAIQETDHRLVIDKALLQKQSAVVEQLEQLMAQHGDKFDAIGEQGKAIGESAEHFVDAIKADLTEVEYDNLQIITPDPSSQSQGCYSGSQVL